MDVIAATAFGVKVDSNKNPNDPFVDHAEKFLSLNLTSPAFLIACKYNFTYLDDV